MGYYMGDACGEHFQDTFASRTPNERTVYDEPVLIEKGMLGRDPILCTTHSNYKHSKK
jgi:hypothetical protein